MVWQYIISKLILPLSLSKSQIISGFFLFLSLSFFLRWLKKWSVWKSLRENVHSVLALFWQRSLLWFNEWSKITFPLISINIQNIDIFHAAFSQDRYLKKSAKKIIMHFMKNQHSYTLNSLQYTITQCQTLCDLMCLR